jgi:hypothetical protein
MTKTKFDLNRAIARLERAEHLADAECNAAWVIHRPRIKRVKSTNERSAKRVVDSASCLHDVSYTMPCLHCRRTKSEADTHREKIRLQIQSNQ